jgi:hypothetical protein
MDDIFIEIDNSNTKKSHMKKPIFSFIYSNQTQKTNQDLDEVRSATTHKFS